MTAAGHSAICTASRGRTPARSSSTSRHGELIDVLRENGFEVERFVELYAPDDAARTLLRLRLAQWAGKWPAEELWLARKREPARAAAAARVDVAPAPRDPPPAADPVRRRRAGLRGARPADADPVEHARGKARSVAAGRRPVLGVDTTVALDGRVHPKPASAEDAAEMLDALGGKTHEVISGLCLRTPAWEERRHASTRVTFRALTPRESAYVARGRVGGPCGRLRDPGLRARLVERSRATT